jgi:hypothetical protein
MGSRAKYLDECRRLTEIAALAHETAALREAQRQAARGASPQTIEDILRIERATRPST